MQPPGKALASHPEAGRSALHSLQAHGKILRALCLSRGDVYHPSSIDILIEIAIFSGIAGDHHQIMALRPACRRHLDIGQRAQRGQGRPIPAQI